MPNAFHEGEIALQERSGERPAAIRTGAGISDTVAPAARSFLAAQRLLVAATFDAGGRAWASLLFGSPGLASTADGRRVALDRSRIARARSEPAWSSLRAGAQLGLLAIDLESRRRLRVNGLVASISDAAVLLDVAEAYPNCPKYIRRRRLDPVETGTSDASVASGTALDADRRVAIARADTLFVASHHPDRGADVSHRGGAVGFAQLLDDHTLRIPDYPGNGMFNTLGNLAVSGAAGLLVPDFEFGRILQMTGQVSLRFDVSEDSRHPTGGTGRHWDFQVERWIESPAPAGFRWERLDASPFNPTPRTGV